MITSSQKYFRWGFSHHVARPRGFVAWQLAHAGIKPSNTNTEAFLLFKQEKKDDLIIIWVQRRSQTADRRCVSNHECVCALPLMNAADQVRHVTGSSACSWIWSLIEQDWSCCIRTFAFTSTCTPMIKPYRCFIFFPKTNAIIFNNSKLLYIYLNYYIFNNSKLLIPPPQQTNPPTQNKLPIVKI